MCTYYVFRTDRRSKYKEMHCNCNAIIFQKEKKIISREAWSHCFGCTLRNCTSGVDGEEERARRLQPAGAINTMGSPAVARSPSPPPLHDSDPPGARRGAGRFPALYSIPIHSRDQLIHPTVATRWKEVSRSRNPGERGPRSAERRAARVQLRSRPTGSRTW